PEKARPEVASGRRRVCQNVGQAPGAAVARVVTGSASVADCAEMRSSRKGIAAAGAALAFGLTGVSGKAATFVVENADAPGKGLKDPTPADPVGGNLEPTRGAQALAAVQQAAKLWGEVIDSPVPIRVSAQFADLPCTATTGKVSSGTPRRFVHDTK